MTRDETLKAAGDAGIVAIHAFGALNWNDEVDALERFAELVAKHEREECAKACEQHAKDSWDHEGGALACADKIRARGEQ